jgi:hypothetical protein
MVKLTKSPLPKGITITSDGDFRSGAVFDILVEDCHGKCYVCEDKPTSINVEHIVPHRDDVALRHDWDNIFLACGHCNSIKGTKYDDIINPTTIDPEDCISLSVEISDDFVGRVDVVPLKQDSVTLKTAELLGYVYNGGSTSIKEMECTNKEMECTNLRKANLLPDIQLFMRYLQEYCDDPDSGYERLIKKEISRSSKFAAFKRKIIRDNTQLSVTFGNDLT